MTEKEVLEQLDFFEQAITKLNADKKELKGNLESATSAYTELKSKTLGSIKYLVENVIEKQEDDIAEIKIEASDISLKLQEITNLNEQNKHDLDKVSELVDYLYSERSGVDASNVSFEEKEELLRNDFSVRLANIDNLNQEHADEIAKSTQQITELEKQKADIEKQLADANESHKKELESLNNEIELLKTHAEELNQNGVALADYKKRVDDLVKQNNETKLNAESEKGILESEVNNLKVTIAELKTNFAEEKANFDESTKVETERLKAKISALEITKTELESEKQELLDKIKRLEAEKAAQVQPRTIESQRDEANFDKDVHSFRFGRTTKAIISKASRFIEALYNSCTETDTYFELNKPEIAAQMAEITEKEMNAFIKQMQLVKYAGQPLIYDFDGRWRSNISMRKMIDFIKEEI